ncbi:MAG: HlyD family type I secretion periplasmic adaptor subunit [Gammaproteobacteria bacterium]|nr:HlyD family type I secretion periplasmic adaptor subunit [Gammaproteobacteria bacterium]
MHNDDEDSTQLGLYGKNDHVYMQSLSAAVVQRSPRHLMLVVLILSLFVLSAVIWMSWAKIDVVIRGSGKVVPASQVQLIQSLEGGIVSEILVKEGQLVDINQPLVKISDIAFSSSFEENRLLYFELQARASRLKAEGFNEDIRVNEEVALSAPEVMQSEIGLFESNRQQLEDMANILEEQISQTESSLDEAKAKKRQLEKSLNLMQKEIKIKKPLKDKGIISEVEFLQLQQREAEIEGELDSVTLSIPRFQSSIDEARFKKQRELLDFSNKAKKELNEVNAEISRIRETQTALQDRVTRTTLRSPVKGIVQRLYTNTIGGVVSPGNEVVEIVPQEDSLLIELKIKPADIASVHEEQTARLKFSAYDFAIHGSLPGQVSFVSADTITNEEGQSFYLVRVKPEQDYLGHESSPLEIKVGMTTEADIITDKKSILSYLMHPVNRGLDKALRER